MQTRPAGGPGRDVLRQDEAARRAARVADVRTELRIDLEAGRPTYDGQATIEFGLRGPLDEPIFLDLTGEARHVTLDGAPIAIDQRDHRLHLPAAGLAERNRLTIDYRAAFDVSGDGFHRFVDPEDGAEYVYSNLEPFSAHRLFPCFDQPDLKGPIELEVTAPADWRVVSAMPVAASEATADGRLRRRHDPTPPIPTYVFSLVAGPWERIGTEHAGVPLGLFGRRSMRHELERAADELLEVTRAGLDHFAELFGMRYPFAKYDQLFVPESNAGAMENAGAVTFHDGFLFRDPPTYAQRIIRAEVVLHELAHMWFGDLVTMRWWDDLWLNETFATYLSYRCLADATRFTDAWQVFNGQMRPAAYRQDQLSTTHPIAAEVRDTDQALGNFDAITYEKGAAVIKQLVAHVGDDAFRRGLRDYIERHRWGNATLDDLLAALGKAAGRSLDGWADAWLRTPSLNTIGARWRARDGRLDHLELWQAAPAEHPTLRPHTTSVALVVDGEDGTGLRVESLPVRLEGAVATVAAAAGLPEPHLVFTNHGDHDYALASLDARSAAFALERLPELPEPLLRQQVWSTLWQMVRDATLDPIAFLDVVERFAPAEQDVALVQAILDRAVTGLQRYLPEALAAARAERLVTVALRAAAGASEGDLRIMWVRAAITAAPGTDALERLISLVDGGWSIDGLEPDQEMRWSVAVKAVAHAIPEAADRIEEEARRDPSDRGVRARLRAGASRPDAAAKAEAWERIHGRGYGSDYRTRSVMAGFQWRHQRGLLEPFREAFFERVRDVHRSRDHAFAESYVRWLVPDLWAEPDMLERLRDEVRGLGPADALLRRQLSEVADDLARAIDVQALVAAGPTA